MSNIIYDNLKKGLLDNTIDLANDTLKVMLLQEYNASDDIITSATTMAATVSFDVSGSSALPLTEISTSGNYTLGGYELSGVTISGGSTSSYMDAGNISASNMSISTGAMLLYKFVTDVSASTPLAYFDFGFNRVSENSIFEIAWNNEGVLTLETKAT